MLEDLRKIFKTDALSLQLATIERLELLADRSALRVRVRIIPDDLIMVATMSWEHVGESYGIFQFPEVGDLVLVGFVNDSEDQAFVLRRLTSKTDKIPLAAKDGHLVIRSRPTKKLMLHSDVEINLTRGDNVVGNEKLVLGDTFKTAYAADLAATIVHKHIDNWGFLTQAPSNAASFEAVKASPVDDSLMLSDLSKTEK